MIIPNIWKNKKNPNHQPVIHSKAYLEIQSWFKRCSKGQDCAFFCINWPYEPTHVYIKFYSTIHFFWIVMICLDPSTLKSDCSWSLHSLYPRDRKQRFLTSKQTKMWVKQQYTNQASTGNGNHSTFLWWWLGGCFFSTHINPICFRISMDWVLGIMPATLHPWLCQDFRPTGQWQVHHHRTAYEFRLGCRGSSITIQMVPNVFSFVMDRIPGSIWSYRIIIWILVSVYGGKDRFCS